MNLCVVCVPSLAQWALMLLVPRPPDCIRSSPDIRNQILHLQATHLKLSRYAAKDFTYMLLFLSGHTVCGLCELALHVKHVAFMPGGFGLSITV